MSRLTRLARQARLSVRRWDRDLLSLAAIACIAVGLGLVAVPLAWLAVGVFLFVAASAGRRNA